MNKKRLILFFLLVVAAVSARSQTRVSGSVKDQVTGAPLSYVSVRIDGTADGCQTDKDGRFAFLTFSEGKALISFNLLGYREELFEIDLAQTASYDITMFPEDLQLEGAVVSARSKSRYSRRGNPAAALASELSRNRDAYRLGECLRTRHELLSIAISDAGEADPFFLANGLYKYADTSLISGKPIVNFSVHETLSKEYHTGSAATARRQVTGSRREGFDDFLTAGEIDGLYERTFPDVDIFRDNIDLLHNGFTSPLSTSAPLVYKFYIADTVDVGGMRCVDLMFSPFNKESLAFIGHLFVTCDSHRICRIQMSTPQEIKLNFVDGMSITQDFDLTSEAGCVISHEEIISYMGITAGLKGAYLKRTLFFGDYDFRPAEEALPPPGDTRLAVCSSRDDQWWREHRIGYVSRQEQSVGDMMDGLRQNRNYHRIETVIGLFFRNYFPVFSQDSGIWGGPFLTFFSSNAVEGRRIKLAAETSAAFSQHLFLSGYVAYGFKDERFKYKTSLEYSFLPKEDWPGEFPVRSIHLSYENDLFLLGQSYLYSSRDNAFLSLRRDPAYPSAYQKKGEIGYEREFPGHFSYSGTVAYRSFSDISYDGAYVPSEGEPGTFGGTEFNVTLRYAPGEQFQELRKGRSTLTPQRPEFILSHSAAFKGPVLSDYSLQRTDLTFRKRFMLNAFGYVNTVTKASAIWNDDAPTILRLMPAANTTFSIHPETFALLRPMEYVSDCSISTDLDWHLNGLLMNRLPLLKHLGLREVLGCRAYLCDDGKPGAVPYVECSAGLENILHFLSVNYVFRLTERGPEVPVRGIQTRIHIQF